MHGMEVFVAHACEGRARGGIRQFKKLAPSIAGGDLMPVTHPSTGGQVLGYTCFLSPAATNYPQES